jgi:molecular chaperone GrpE
MSPDDVLPEETQTAADVKAEETLSGDAPNETPTLESLTQALAAAQEKTQENWDRFIRTQAELENLKRRAEKDVQNAHKFAIEKFARELLSVADSLELGLGVESSDNPEVAKLREGMELTLKQLQAGFEKFQLVAVNPEGEKFNPELHQAMAMQPTPDAEANTVLKVYQKGYLLSERLLRPAMVVVAQAPQ